MSAALMRGCSEALTRRSEAPARRRRDWAHSLVQQRVAAMPRGVRFFLLSACAWGMLIVMAHLSWLWIHGDLVWMTALALAFGLGLWHALGAPERRGRRYFCRQLARLRQE